MQLKPSARRFWSLLIVFGVLLAARPASAELLTIRLETFGEKPPQSVCILADAMTLKGASDGSLLELAMEQGVKPSVAGRCEPQLDRLKSELGKRGTHRCFAEAGGRGTAILVVRNAEVAAVELGYEVLKLQLKKQLGKADPADVVLAGGDFFGQDPVSFRLSDGTQLLDLRLRPRCVQRELTLPDYVCPDSRARDENHGFEVIEDAAAPVSEKKPLRMLVARVHNPENAVGSIRVGRCGNTFESTWTGPVPPSSFRLEATEFWFRWRSNCLNGNQCPNPQVLGLSVACGAGKLESTSDGATCTYTCSGRASFPVEVQFSPVAPGGTSVTQSWSETLGAPGQTLYGYVPGEQRRIQINWSWPRSVSRNAPDDCTEISASEPDAAAKVKACEAKNAHWYRELRAQRAGDEIDHVEIRTPEGRTSTIKLDTRQLRIPELDCHDRVSYRYVGNRIYKEVSVEVQAQGRVDLADPNDARIDHFTIGAALGGGERYLVGASGRPFGPQLAFDAIFVIRDVFSQRRWMTVVPSVELRIGGRLSEHPYCWRTANGAELGECEPADWLQVLYWRVPITAGLTFDFARNTAIVGPFRVGAAAGVAPTTYHLASDQGRTQQPVLFLWRALGAYKVTRSFSFEGQFDLFLGERVRETVSDDAGVRRAGVLNSIDTSMAVSVLARIDDLF